MGYDQWALMMGAVFSGLSVLLGAFAAHALAHMVTPDRLEIFETGGPYQFYHGLALLVLGIYMTLDEGEVRSCVRVFGCWVLGVCLFSGSLYAYVMTGSKFWVKITPLGGVSMIIGWGVLVLDILKRRS
ncbi:MAG: hypothetical protein CL521_01505 [Actinobacteria bacterium]|nr:hypothetical protein [Actinomycetota bacterium]